MFANALALQPDGKILVGGQFHRYDGQSRTNLVRLVGQRVFARKAETRANGAILLSWEILPNRQIWRIERSEDLRAWSTVKENVSAGLVQVEDTGNRAARFFRVIPDE